MLYQTCGNTWHHDWLKIWNRYWYVWLWFRSTANQISCFWDGCWLRRPSFTENKSSFVYFADGNSRHGYTWETEWRSRYPDSLQAARGPRESIRRRATRQGYVLVDWREYCYSHYRLRTGVSSKKLLYRKENKWYNQSLMISLKFFFSLTHYCEWINFIGR